MRRLARDRRGGTAVLLAGAMPLLIGLTAIAVDVGAVQLDTRRLQGVADAAALAAASGLPDAQAAADAAVARAGWSRAITVTAVAGGYSADPTRAPAARFAAGAAAPDAATVTLASTTPSFLAAIFGRREVAISRRATAQRIRLAAFSIGSRLASLQGGLVNAYLSALTGSTIALSVMDGEALANADVDLFGYLDALRTRGSLGAVSYDQVLGANVSSAVALGALAAALDGEGRAGAAAAIRTLAAAAPGRTISLDALIDAGRLGKATGGGSGNGRVGALDLATALLQLSSGQRQLTLDLGAGIPGLATTRVTLAVGERPANSPWLAVGDTGLVVRTAQARLYAETTLAAASFPGLGNLVALKVPLFVELASAEARLAGIDCPAAPAVSQVRVEARGNPGQAALGSVDPAALGDFRTAVAVRPATLIDTLLVDVEGFSRIDLGAAEAWQPLTFSRAEITAGTAKSVASSTPVGGIAASLARQATVTVRLVGLGVGVDPLTRAVGTALAGAAPALDTLLGLATGTLGVKVGEAEVRVTGLRCGAAVLVG